MTLSQKIAAERNKKGMTQEELAGIMKVSVRTVQRIENSKGIPRKYTLKAVAEALGLPFEELYPNKVAGDTEEAGHFLILLCASCFSYLVLPYIHFLIPRYLLNKRNEQNVAIKRFARTVIRGQVYWIIATMLFFLLVLLVNMLQHAYLKNPHFINYLLPFFIMYLLNAVIIVVNMRKAGSLSL